MWKRTFAEVAALRGRIAIDPRRGKLYSADALPDRSNTMRAGLICTVILFASPLAEAAKPKPTSENNADYDASPIEALERKQAQAQQLQAEIERLRQFVAAPGPEIRLRIRIIQVSIDGTRQMGVALPRNGGDALRTERQLTALLAHYGLVKLVADKRLSLVEGVEGRIRAGAEFPAEALANVDADPAKFSFRGIEVAATPKTQADGRLTLSLICRQFRPILYSDLGPQLRVDEVSTAVKLAPDAVIILEGPKQEVVASEVRGFSKSGLDVGQETHTVHRLQTLVVVSRGPLLTDAESKVR